MAGIYIHIPFCASRCIYCGFYSTTRHDLRQRYVDAVCKEMTMRGKGGEKIETIYLGGGTPSQLSEGQLRQLFIFINKVYGMSHVGEVTMECNPDDITDEFAQMLSRLPVNRVSMGVQTFCDDRLRFLRRRHRSEQIPLAVKKLRGAGIANISIDLMYGFPQETLAEWQQDVDRALELNVEHLSAYALMYEEGTPLYQMLQEREVEEQDEEVQLQMFAHLMDRLKAAGFEHYEISNFAKPGFRSRHNSSYWHAIPYIGLGAAAHSYDGNSRQWNVDDVEQYIEHVELGQPIVESEALDEDTRYNEQMMTALRTCEGLPLGNLTPTQQKYCLEQARPFINDQLLVIADNSLRLTRRGIFVSNMVMSGLMKV